MNRRLLKSMTDVVSTAADFGLDTLTLSRWSAVADSGPTLAKRQVTPWLQLLGSADSTSRSVHRAMGGTMHQPGLSRTVTPPRRSCGGICTGGIAIGTDPDSPSAGFVATRVVLTLPVPVLAQLAKSTDKEDKPLPPEATPFVVDALDRAARDQTVPVVTRGDAIGALGALSTCQTTWVLVHPRDLPLRLDIVARLHRLCALPAAGEAPLAKLAKEMSAVASHTVESDDYFSRALTRLTGVTSPTLVATIPSDDSFHDDSSVSDGDGDGVGDGGGDVDVNGDGSGGNGSDNVIRCSVLGVHVDPSSNTSITTALAAHTVGWQVGDGVRSAGGFEVLATCG